MSGYVGNQGVKLLVGNVSEERGSLNYEGPLIALATKRSTCRSTAAYTVATQDAKIRDAPRRGLVEASVKTRVADVRVAVDIKFDICSKSRNSCTSLA
jgi:hypothetical protein